MKTFVLSALCGFAICAQAEVNDQKKKLEESFRQVPIPELGVQAAQLIRSTPPLERSATAVAAVETILQRHPAAAVSVVSAVSKAAPEAAAAVAAAASRVVPASSEYIAIAARNAAPAYHDSINNIQPASASQAIPSHGENAISKESEHGNGNGNGNGNSSNGQGNGAENSRRGGTVRDDDTLPNGKPRPPIPVPPNHPPHPEHPEHPAHPPHPITYNHPHEHGDDDGDSGRDEHGH